MKKKPHKVINNEPLVEILDNAGEPILKMSLSQSIKKKLTRKIVLVAIKNTKNQLLLQKHNTKSSLMGLWDISIYSDVYADESYEDAAYRAMFEQLGITHSSLRAVAQIPYINTHGLPLLAKTFTTSHLTLQEEKITHSLITKNEVMFIYLDELNAIISHSPELFTAELIWAIQGKWLS